jgi:predicted GNAT family acetyltransferase
MAERNSKDGGTQPTNDLISSDVADTDDQAVVGASGDVDVSDDSSASRFEARIGGELAGFLDYRVRDGRVVLVHTEVEDAFEGRGVGSTLVRQALDDIAAGEREVVVQCEFVQSWLERHPDYQKLVAPQG